MTHNDPGRTPRPLTAEKAPHGQFVAVDNGRERAQGKSTTKAGQGEHTETRDSIREIAETIVFVIVLVLLLKTFVAEAFVIPTGSMAETLYGYQKIVRCEKCGIEFPVNTSRDADPQPGLRPAQIIACECPNCRYHQDLSRSRSWSSGDRVLVAKYLYDLDVLGFKQPERYQVVVFKYPREPNRDHIAYNYIKRLIGLPGETIAIRFGNLYRYEGLRFEADLAVPENERWHSDYMHTEDETARRLFRQGEFKILRKPPRQVLAERRLVFDNDHQPKDLVGKVQPRWQPIQGATGWTVDKTDEPREFRYAPANSGALSWLRYSHLIPDSQNRTEVRKELITDFMGYNSWETEVEGRRGQGLDWVGDLMLECTVQVARPEGEIVLELSKGIHRFQARFDLATGRCSLARIRGDNEDQLESKSTGMNRPGKYRLRFANVDDRLLVWVDSSLPFGDGVNYDPSSELGAVEENDLNRPASIGVRNAEAVFTNLKLWRDTYYKAGSGREMKRDAAHLRPDMPDSQVWDDMPLGIYYVQPGHYLCLGDNSPESSDGRSWGTVPERLLLGRALFIYYPFSRAGRIE